MQGDSSTPKKRVSKHIEEKQCIVCQKPFLIHNGKRGGVKSASVRHKHSKTCSKLCAKEYIRHRSKYLQ